MLAGLMPVTCRLGSYKTLPSCGTESDDCAPGLSLLMAVLGSCPGLLDSSPGLLTAAS